MSTQERPEEGAPVENYPEKGSGPFERETTDLKPEEGNEEDDIRDLFVPLPPLKGVPAEENPLTVRSVVVGVVLGTLVNASNVYLGKLEAAGRARVPRPQCE